ncbi:hypothetical protein [Kribbella speibonae]|uniref:Antitoxin n=1 Tax=Kribbella speibonae TaxID=1572660 RepID=A0A4V2M2Q4_9ACTN|nr:hypothetical protein [Kribbella speibonae]TCC29062.1 hypothetical protein E0H92_43595 [Kribbella speibonae]
MSSDETPHILASGERIWVIGPSAAADHLPQMLERFRSGETGPFIVGDAGQPEGVLISWDLWQRLAVLSADTLEFDHIYDIARERLADKEQSVPLEDVAAEFGWDLNEPIDDSDLPKK